MLKQTPSRYVLLALSFTLYLSMAYGIERHQTLPLLASYFTLFFLYLHIIAQREKTDEGRTKFWIGAAILFRAVLLFAVPSLSDDFYRFIWDGRLLAA